MPDVLPDGSIRRGKIKFFNFSIVSLLHYLKLRVSSVGMKWCDERFVWTVHLVIKADTGIGKCVSCMVPQYSYYKPNQYT